MPTNEVENEEPLPLPLVAAGLHDLGVMVVDDVDGAVDVVMQGAATGMTGRD